MYSTYVIRLVIGFVNTLYVYEVSTSLFRVKLHRELDVHDLLCGPNNCTLRMRCLCPTLSHDGIYRIDWLLGGCAYSSDSKEICA